MANLRASLARLGRGVRVLVSVAGPHTRVTAMAARVQNRTDPFQIDQAQPIITQALLILGEIHQELRTGQEELDSLQAV